MRVVILVPVRYGDPKRDRLWAFCKPRWQKFFPKWEIFEGEHREDEGPFNRSLAINRAAEAAGKWDVALIIDNDVVGDPRAIESCAEAAAKTNQLVVAHDQRVMLTKFGTQRVLDGEQGSWHQSKFVERIWTDSVSCIVGISRETWDAVGGFDPAFRGWGREDSAFQLVCEAYAGPLLRVGGQTFHLWHPVSQEAERASPTRQANEQRFSRYLDARWDLERLLELRKTKPWTPIDASDRNWTGEIPKILHRTVPEARSREVEKFWNEFRTMYPDWELKSWDEPLDPADFPITSPVWPHCSSGAQKAGLIRLELLWTHGGVYVDSDVQPLRRWDELLSSRGFAAWEDSNCIPDAVLGAVPGHAAFGEMLNTACEYVIAGRDAWHSGPGITTKALPGRSDVLTLPPGAFYPYHYLEKARARENFRATSPWAYAVHHWHGSWLTPEQKESQKARQR